MANPEHVNDSMFKITLNLTMAAFLSGLIIAVVYYFTAPIAEIQRVKMKEQSMKELIPDATSFAPIKGKEEWYRAEKDGKLLAYILLASEKGFDGHVKLLVGVNLDQEVIGYKVLSHKETPGLGDQAFKPKFADQFKGKRYQQLELVKIQEEGKITAITGATITSRAVTNGVRRSLVELEKYLNENK